MLKSNILSSDRAVSSTEDWERSLPGHLYSYHIHDTLSVKFVFDDNGGDEVRTACSLLSVWCLSLELKVLTFAKYFAEYVLHLFAVE